MMVRKDLDIAKEIARRLRKRIGPELEHEIDVSLKLYSVDDFKWKMAMGVPFMKSILQSGIPL